MGFVIYTEGWRLTVDSTVLERAALERDIADSGEKPQVHRAGLGQGVGFLPLLTF